MYSGILLRYCKKWNRETATELGFLPPAVGLQQRATIIVTSRERAAHGWKQEAEFCCSCALILREFRA